MLKIQIWMRGTMEYSRDTIAGPMPDQTKEMFEEIFIESDECYSGGDVYETCPYFDFEDGRDDIKVYLGGDEHIQNHEEPFFETSDWNQFKFEEGGGCNYVPQEPDNVGEVNIWWSHDMKFNYIYYLGEKPEYIPSFQRTNWQLNQDREYNVLKTKVYLMFIHKIKLFDNKHNYIGMILK